MSVATQLVEALNRLRAVALPISRELSANAATRRLALTHAGAFHLDPAHWRLLGEMLGWTNAPNAVIWLAKAFWESPEHRAIILGRWDAIGASCQTVGTFMHCAIEFGIRR
jgi:hypothetical protein